jgi:chromosomal replication initiator protein
MQPSTLAMVPPTDAIESSIQAELQQAIGQRNYEHWFDHKTTWAVNGDQLTIGVGSPFLLNWMQKQFRSPLLQAAQAALGSSARICFEVDAQMSPQHRAKTSDLTPAPSAAAGGRNIDSRKSDPAASAQPPSVRAAASAERRFADLGDFVKGGSNELALTAVQQMCDAPGARFNPLFLHGGVGIGKTHLLEGSYRRIRRQFPALKVVFLTSEAFANYFTQALREHTLPSFRQRFRNVDVLLVDDIDFLDAKRVIQEEFLHTFKQLQSHGRQIVLTSDRHPRLLTKLSDELTTRFLSGMVCRIEAPDCETRLQIVERKAAQKEAKFSPEALKFVAERFKNNVRELEGALNCLQTYYCMTGKRIGIGTARQVLADLERDCIRILRLSDIENAVCNLFGLEPKDLKSPSRSRSLSQPRMLAMFLARKYTQAAYSEIGQYFGGRNHSTVMSAEKRVQDWLKEQSTIKVAAQNWPFSDVIETLEQQLHAG